MAIAVVLPARFADRSSGSGAWLKAGGRTLMVRRRSPDGAMGQASRASTQFLVANRPGRALLIEAAWGSSHASRIASGVANASKVVGRMYAFDKLDLSRDGSALVITGPRAPPQATWLDLWIDGAFCEKIEIRPAPPKTYRRINRLASDHPDSPMHGWVVEGGGGEGCGMNFAPQWTLRGADTGFLYTKQAEGAATFECPVEGRRMTAEAGETYSFSGNFGVHRCSARLELSFFDSAGRTLDVIAGEIPPGFEGGPSLTDYVEVVVIAQAPARTAALSVSLCKGATTAGSDSFLFFTLLSLCRGEDGAAQSPLTFSPAVSVELFVMPQTRSAIFLPVWPASLPRDAPADIVLIEPASGARFERLNFCLPREDELELEVFGLEGAAIVAQALVVPARRRRFTLLICVDGETASATPLSGLKSSDMLRLVLPASACDGREHLFQVREESSNALLGQFTDIGPDKLNGRAALRHSGGPTPPMERAYDRGSAQLVDTRARTLLSQLSGTRIGALFDLGWIFESSGLKFKTPGQALTSYFLTTRSERFSPTPYFDRDAYVRQLDDFLDDDIDAFCHFISKVQNRGRPTLLIDTKRLMQNGRSASTGLETFCDLLAGAEFTSFHALVDLAYIRSQAGYEDVATLDVLTAVSDPDRALPFSPHPLFDPSFYRLQINPGCRNELVDYLKHQRNSIKTHPLMSPEFVFAQGGPTARLSTLEYYVTSWPKTVLAPSLFVAPAYLNHKMTLAGIPATEEPLSEFIRRGLTDEDWLHPEIDRRFLATAFSNLETSADTVALLSAALQMPAAAAWDQPWLSVIIVTYNKPVYTAITILAALNALRTTPHEIIVIENAGEPHHHEELLRIFAGRGSVNIIKMQRNRYFGEGNNVGLDQARGAYVLFLNNDCFLTPGFGETLQKICSSASEPVHAIGAALRYPNGDIQEFGGTIQDDGAPIQNLKHLSGEYLDDMDGLTQVDYASAACLCVSRHALSRVAGFDPLYEPFYFEDTDLCRRLTQAGFSIHVSPRLQAVHIENATTRDFLGDGFDPLVRRNRDRFARRWIKNKGADTYVRRPLKTSDMKRTALIHSPFDIVPGGGEAYLLNAARALSQTHRTVFAMPERVSHARIEFACHALGIEPFAFEVATMGEAMSHNAEFDVTFVMGNEIVPPIAPLGRLNLYHLQFPFPWRNVGAFDFQRISGYDAVIVNSAFTAEWTAKRLEQVGMGDRAPPIHVLHPPVRALTFADRSPLAGRPLRLANVGRFFVGGHSKRQDVFVEIVAQLRSAKVDVTGVLIGSATQDEDAKLFFSKVAERAKALGVELIGECSRADIARTLQHADIYLHCGGYEVDTSLAPERVEHFGIAIVEAMTAGAYPVVVNAGGPAEIIRAAGVGGVFDTVTRAKALIRDFQANPKSTASGLPWATSVSETRFSERLLALVESFDCAAGKEKRFA